jgi:hypothetical protein
VESALAAAADSIQETVALGRESLRPSFWILSAGALLDYEARWVFSGNATSELDPTNPSMLLTRLGLALFGFVALTILTTVFLLLIPLQDGLLRGRAIGLGGAFRALSRCMGPLTLSCTAQALLVLAVPFAVVSAYVYASVAGVDPVEGVPNIFKMQEVARASAMRALWPSAVWIIVTSILFVFALPYVILEQRGPLRSIGLSVSLVLRRCRAESGRFWAFAGTWIGAATVVMLPVILLNMTTTVTSREQVLLNFFAWGWRSLATAFAIPWCCASLVILFRHLVPASP